VEKKTEQINIEGEGDDDEASEVKVVVTCLLMMQVGGSSSLWCKCVMCPG